MTGIKDGLIAELAAARARIRELEADVAARREDADRAARLVEEQGARIAAVTAERDEARKAARRWKRIVRKTRDDMRAVHDRAGTGEVERDLTAAKRERDALRERLRAVSEELAGANAALARAGTVAPRPDDFIPMGSAPHDRMIEGRTEDGEIDVVCWRNDRRCMLADLAPGAGTRGDGWVSALAGYLPIDPPTGWREMTDAGRALLAQHVVVAERAPEGEVRHG